MGTNSKFKIRIFGVVKLQTLALAGLLNQCSRHNRFVLKVLVQTLLPSELPTLTRSEYSVGF